MLGIVKPALQFLAGIVALIKLWADKFTREETKNEGRKEVAAEELPKIEEARHDREILDREIARKSDADLDHALDKWMRD